jgi:hypothetical protein
MVLVPGDVGPLGPVGTGPYCDMCAVVEAGEALSLPFFFLLRKKKRPAPTMARAATPPTVPPAMAPTFVLLPPPPPLDAEVEDADWEAEEVSEALVAVTGALVGLLEKMCVADQIGS